MECPCCEESVEDLKTHLAECPKGPSPTSMSPNWTDFEGPFYGPGANAQHKE